ncbi:unnamed protein product [Pleuronectes platessa]|uniref:Uncharacterized protein n=1 Tax=Pleuronectes platessa TaxID=8262 RepID=A0A9N7TSR7_PLEPL|nr:unnamed protein product [Pleuronectes platessa]
MCWDPSEKVGSSLSHGWDPVWYKSQLSAAHHVCVCVNTVFGGQRSNLTLSIKTRRGACARSDKVTEGRFTLEHRDISFMRLLSFLDSSEAFTGTEERERWEVASCV